MFKVDRDKHTPRATTRLYSQCKKRLANMEHVEDDVHIIAPQGQGPRDEAVKNVGSRAEQNRAKRDSAARLRHADRSGATTIAFPSRLYQHHHLSKRDP